MRPFARRTRLLSSPFSTSPIFSSPPILRAPKISASQNHRSACQVEEDSRVSVWWDFENCGVPSEVNVLTVAHNISAAVRASGIKGSIRITAFGDMLQLSRSRQEALCATGIGLTHIPAGGKNSADRSLFIDLMDWVSVNPPPAHLFLISSDGDFATILHRLKMNNYNILLASREAPTFLASAATLTWNWHLLVRGQCLAGRCPNGSGNGHSKEFPGPGVSPEPKRQLSQGIAKRAVKPVDQIQKREGQNIKSITKSDSDNKCIPNVVETKKVSTISVEMQEPSRNVKRIVHEQVSESVSTLAERQDVLPENGFLWKIRKWWVGDDLRCKDLKSEN